MRRLIRNLKTSPHFWLVFASLAMRGAGFLTTLFLSRIYGAGPLGIYSVTVNTAVAVSTPFTLVLANNATVFGAEGIKNTDKKNYYGLLCRTTLSVASIAALLSILAFVGSYSALQSANQPFVLFPVIAGVIVIVGEMIGVVSQGFLYGAGKFHLAARTNLLVAITVCIIAFPIVKLGGLDGALLLLVAISIVPPIFMTAAALSIRVNAAWDEEPVSDVWREVRDGMFRGTPTFIITIINNLSYWACTVYLVQASYGAIGVGVVAVAGQWLNLMLIPATSWGSLSVKILADLVLKGDMRGAWNASKDLVKKNVIATLALSSAIASVSGVIAYIYNLAGTDLVLIICINAVFALIKAANMVLDRFLFVLDLQRWSACLSLLSCLVQILMTYVLLQHALWTVALASLLAALFLCMLNYASVCFFSRQTKIAY